MIHYAEYDTSGKYIIKGNALSQDDVVATPGGAIYFGEVDALSQYHDLVNNVPVNFPPRPSRFHTFDYATKQWVDRRTPETEWPLVRAKRDKLLLASDWTQLPDVPLSTREAWTTYRQALRDITTQTDPFNIVWPVAPG